MAKSTPANKLLQKRKDRGKERKEAEMLGTKEREGEKERVAGWKKRDKENCLKREQGCRLKEKTQKV